MSSDEQREKNEAGLALRQTVETMLNILVSAGLISGFEGAGTSANNSPHIGYPDKDSDQFRCDYIYSLPDGTEIMIHTTTSYDNGRFKTKEWDSYHFKRIRKSIKKALVLYPDSLDNQHSFGLIKSKIKKKEVVSFIDDIYSQTEFFYFLENEILGEELNGSKAAKVGTIFELAVKHVLESKQNFDAWKNQNASSITWRLGLYAQIMNSLGIDRANVSEVRVQNDIPGLPEYTFADGSKKRGGKAKTDVIMHVDYSDGSTVSIPFSCKNTTKDNVHVNQFSPKYVVDVLQMQPASEIEELLELYRQDGGPKNFKTNHPVEYQRLETLFAPYVDTFEEWCLCGTQREGSSELQRATHIVSCRLCEDGTEVFDVKNIKEYLRLMHAGKKRRTFGTVFNWTVTKKDANGNNEIRVKAKL